MTSSEQEDFGVDRWVNEGGSVSATAKSVADGGPAVRDQRRRARRRACSTASGETNTDGSGVGTLWDTEA
jgi:hypothetical protein